MSDVKSLALIPKSITEVQSLSELISQSSLLPDALRGKPADVIVSILAGAELGMPPMASIRGVHVVSGKPVLAADTMMGLVLASGLAEYFAQVDSTGTSVTFETKRKGAPKAQRCTWTIDDAKKAGIYKNAWLTYPRQMLAARAKAELARAAYPDLLAGVYDPDEVSFAAPPLPPANDSGPTGPVEQIDDAEIVDTNNDETATAINDIDGAESIEALKAVAKTIASRGLSTTAKDAVNERYKARLAFFRSATPPKGVPTAEVAA